MVKYVEQVLMEILLISEATIIYCNAGNLLPITKLTNDEVKLLKNILECHLLVGGSDESLLATLYQCFLQVEPKQI